MFTKLATPATPVTRPKSHIAEIVTWVKGYKASLDESATDLKLKSWYKTSTSQTNEPVTKVGADVIDFDNFKYLVETSEEPDEEEEKPAPGTENSELKLALSIEKKDDQISSLSGLGM